MVVCSGCQFAQRKESKERSYVVRSDFAYDSVVHEHPRIRIPIEHSEVDKEGSVGGKVILSNTDTGKSMVIFGVNHWNWSGSDLYVFPVYSPAEYNTKLEKKLMKLIYPDANITIIAEDTKNTEYSDGPIPQANESKVPTQFTNTTVLCPMCSQQIPTITLYSHVPKCYTSFCKQIMRCEPLCTCSKCKSVSTHKIK